MSLVNYLCDSPSSYHMQQRTYMLPLTHKASQRNQKSISRRFWLADITFLLFHVFISIFFIGMFLVGPASDNIFNLFVFFKFYSLMFVLKSFF